MSAQTRYGSLPSAAHSYDKEAPDSSPAKPRRGSIILGVILFTSVVFATLATQYSSARNNDYNTLSFGKESNDDDDSFSFNAANKYITLYGKIGRHYPWVDAPVLEPYLESTLTATSYDPEKEYKWTSQADTSGQTLELTGYEIRVTYQKVDSYVVTVKELEGGHLTRSFTGKILVRYVRRELRGLDDTDRSSFMRAAATLWNVNADDGKETFGTNYRDIEYLASLHNRLAADRDCDHMHDGLGFMTMHSGLSYIFEKSIQSVDPSVAMPYWDWTVDVTSNAYLNKSNAELWSWNVWGSEYFGIANNNAHTVSEGPWAFTRLPTDYWNDTHNPYGYMRAPWNMNSLPYVTRFNYTGSAAKNFAVTDMGMPTCMDFWNLIEDSDSWFDFGWGLQYDPHARVHSVIGGSEAGTSFENNIAKHFDDDVNEIISKIMFVWTKNMWRNYKVDFPTVCSPDTPQHACVGSCSDIGDEIQNRDIESYINTFGDSTVISSIKSLVLEDQIEVVTAMCESSLCIGDQMESASPTDISFWPIHPNLERVWMIKKLSGTFTDESWPQNSTSKSSDGSTCYGHGSEDLLPMEGIVSGTEGVEWNATNLTNSEWYRLLDPLNGHMPYLYDDFTLKHCNFYNLSFEQWLPTTDDEFI